MKVSLQKLSLFLAAPLCLGLGLSAAPQQPQPKTPSSPARLKSITYSQTGQWFGVPSFTPSLGTLKEVHVSIGARAFLDQALERFALNGGVWQTEHFANFVVSHRYGPNGSFVLNLLETRLPVSLHPPDGQSCGGLDYFQHTLGSATSPARVGGLSAVLRVGHPRFISFIGAWNQPLSNPMNVVLAANFSHATGIIGRGTGMSSLSGFSYSCGDTRQFVLTTSVRYVYQP